MGWELVVTFREMRRHLGVETQRQLSHQVNRSSRQSMFLTNSREFSGSRSSRLGLSEIAELACLEPIEYQLEGARANMSTPVERVLQAGDGKEYHRDHPANDATISLCAQVFSRPKR
jgi:hypothetical protein